MKSRNTIERLYRYRDTLYKLRELGFKRVYSDDLGEAIGAAASQVRKDFSMFEIKGYRRGGYIIEHLLEDLNRIIGKDQVQKVVIVGTGNVGKALMDYTGFTERKIKVVAGFDNNPSKINKKIKPPILPVDGLSKYIKSHKIKIGIIAVPDSAAQDIYNIMASSGIMGVLNFAPISLKEVNNCQVNSVNLRVELETLIYFVNMRGKQ